MKSAYGQTNILQMSHGQTNTSCKVPTSKYSKEIAYGKFCQVHLRANLVKKMFLGQEWTEANYLENMISAYRQRLYKSSFIGNMSLNRSFQ